MQLPHTAKCTILCSFAAVMCCGQRFKRGVSRLCPLLVSDPLETFSPDALQEASGTPCSVPL